MYEYYTFNNCGVKIFYSYICTHLCVCGRQGIIFFLLFDHDCWVSVVCVRVCVERTEVLSANRALFR